MKPVLILYATREGRTQRVADRLARTVRFHGLPANNLNAASLPEGFELNDYCAAIVCASVHGGKHEDEVLKFVKLYLPELHEIPTAFVSVSLSEAAAEDTGAPPERRAKAAADVHRMIEMFLTETGWRPTVIRAVAGALKFTKYNFLLRFVMKRIARKAGAGTDTSKDYEYTDWEGLDHFVTEFTKAINVETPA